MMTTLRTMHGHTLVSNMLKVVKDLGSRRNYFNGHSITA